VKLDETFKPIAINKLAGTKETKQFPMIIRLRRIEQEYTRLTRPPPQKENALPAAPRGFDPFNKAKQNVLLDLSDMNRVITMPPNPNEARETALRSRMRRHSRHQLSSLTMDSQVTASPTGFASVLHSSLHHGSETGNVMEGPLAPWDSRE
jgi:hypothetical protein